MQLKGWQKIVLAAGLVAVPILSCGQRSLVLMEVTVSGNTTFSNATLAITANDDVKTDFPGVTLDQTPYKAGVYLPSDMTGMVTFKAEVDQSGCIVGTGTATADVSSGGTTGPVQVTITPMVPCTPITDGGSSGSAGTGGAAGTGGTGGLTGAAGSGGKSGAAGSGGTSGTSGAAGSTGAAGTGSTGTGGRGGRGGAAGGTTGAGGTGSGKGGSVGTGGTTGAGGSSSGGTTGAGGTGKGGTTGAAGTSGKAGTGGSTTGSAGTAGCMCTANETCNSSGTCVCTQTAAEACAANGVGCGTTMNICGKTVTCTCPVNSVCDVSTETCTLTVCPTGAGGSITTLEQGQIVCPL